MTKKAVAIENNLSDISLPGSAMLTAAVVDGALAIFTRLRRKDFRELKITRELLCTWRRKIDIYHSADI